MTEEVSKFLKLQGITEKELIAKGFSTGTAYNILQGTVSKRSLYKLLDLGLIKVSEKYLSSTTLYGEFISDINSVDIVLDKDSYKVRVELLINRKEKIYYILDVEDVFSLLSKNINIFKAKKVLVKVVGKKVNFIKEVIV